MRYEVGFELGGGILGAEILCIIWTMQHGLRSMDDAVWTAMPYGLLCNMDHYAVWNMDYALRCYALGPQNAVLAAIEKMTDFDTDLLSTTQKYLYYEIVFLSSNP